MTWNAELAVVPAGARAGARAGGASIAGTAIRCSPMPRRSSSSSAPTRSAARWGSTRRAPRSRISTRGLSGDTGDDRAGGAPDRPPGAPDRGRLGPRAGGGERDGAGPVGTAAARGSAAPLGGGVAPAPGAWSRARPQAARPGEQLPRRARTHLASGARGARRRLRRSERAPRRAGRARTPRHDPAIHAAREAGDA